MHLHLPSENLDCPVEELEGECGQLGEYLRGMVGRLEDHLLGAGLQVKSEHMQFVRMHGEFESIDATPGGPHGVVPVPLVPSRQEADAFKQLKSEVAPPCRFSQ